MAQYDILLTQNVEAAGIEYSEVFVNIARGGILTANAAQAPTVLPVGGNGYVLQANDTQVSGLSWAVPVTVSNQSNNRVVTATATANSLNAEANLTFDGSTLVVSGDISLPAVGNKLLFGDGDSYFVEYADDVLQLYLNSVAALTVIESYGRTIIEDGYWRLWSAAGTGVILEGVGGTSNGSSLHLRAAPSPNTFVPGSIYLEPGVETTGGDRGSVFIGSGASGYLGAKTAETNVVYYDTATGLLSYGVPVALTSGVLKYNNNTFELYDEGDLSGEYRQGTFYKYVSSPPGDPLDVAFDAFLHLHRLYTSTIIFDHDGSSPSISATSGGALYIGASDSINIESTAAGDITLTAYGATNYINLYAGGGVKVGVISEYTFGSGVTIGDTYGSLVVKNGTIYLASLLEYGVGENDYILYWDSATGKITYGAAPSGGVSASGTPANDQIAVWTSSSAIEGSTNFTYTGSVFSVGSSSHVYFYFSSSGTGNNASIYFREGTTNRGLVEYNATSNGVTITAISSPQAEPAIFVGDTNNHVCIGGTTDDATYELYVAGDIYATGNIEAFSDVRHKNVMAYLGGVFPRLDNIKPIVYKWKEGHYGDWRDDEVSYGFIAQQVKRIFPYAARYDKEKDKYSLRVVPLIAINTVAIKEVKSEVDILKGRVLELEREVSKLQNKHNKE